MSMLVRVGILLGSSLLVLVGGSRPVEVEVSASHPGQLIEVKGRTKEEVAHVQARHAAKASSLGDLKASRIHRHAHEATGSLGANSSHTGAAKAKANATHATKEEPETKDKKKPETTDNEKPAATEEEQEKKLEKQESKSFMSGLSSLATAVSDPKDFLLELPEMKLLQDGLRKAIEMSENKGICLKDGDFKGLGCAPGGSNSAPICSCASMLDHCFIPADPSETVKLFTSGDTKGAIEKAKVVIFGQCTISYIMVGALAGAGLLVVLILLCVARSLLIKKKSRGSRNSSSD